MTGLSGETHVTKQIPADYDSEARQLQWELSLREKPQALAEWQREFDAKWENLKRYGYSKGDFRTNGPRAAADESVHSGPVSADSHPEATEKTGPDTPAERGGDA